MFVTKTLLVFAFALSASALSVPHIARNPHHHRSIAVRASEPVSEPEHVVVKPKRKRNLNKRCSPESNSTALSSATSIAVSSSVVPASSVFTSSATPSVSVFSSSSAVPSTFASSSVFSSSSDPVSSSAAPINVGNNVPTFSSSVVQSSYTPISVDTPSSIYVAPTTSVAPTYTPTTTATPTYTPTTSYVATTTSAADSSEPSWLVSTNSGQGTYYDAGLGACGITNTDSDYIVAVSWLLFDNFPGYDGTNPNTNPVCNKQITANYEGKSVTVTVTDRCTGCDLTSLDFTPTAFQDMADLSIGRLSGVTWSFT